MNQTVKYIERLEALKEGERARLRRHVGLTLDETLAGFDLFTGLWWPLRQKSAAAPRRETSWLVAKLFGAFPLPHVQDASTHLVDVLQRGEPQEERTRKRFQTRFDRLLQSPISDLEPHLLWALSVVAKAIRKGQVSGLDWAQLLDDLSIWDRGDQHRRGRDIRDIWAERYLNAVQYVGRKRPC